MPANPKIQDPRDGAPKSSKTFSMPAPPPPPVISKKVENNQRIRPNTPVTMAESSSSNVVIVKSSLTQISTIWDTPHPNAIGSSVNPNIAQMYNTISWMKWAEEEIMKKGDELRSLNSKLQDKQAELTIKNDRLADLHSQVEKVTLEKRKIEVDSSSQIKLLNVDNSLLKKEVIQLRLENEKKQTSINNLVSGRKQLEAEVNAQKLVVSKLQSTNDTYEMKMSKLTTDNTRLLRQVKSTSGKLDVSLLQVKLLKTEIQLGQNENVKLSSGFDVFADTFKTKMNDGNKRYKKLFEKPSETVTEGMESGSTPSPVEQDCSENGNNSGDSSSTESTLPDAPPSIVIEDMSSEEEKSEAKGNDLKRKTSASDSETSDSLQTPATPFEDPRLGKRPKAFSISI